MSHSMSLTASTKAVASPTVGRKGEHIRINLEEDVQGKGVDNGFADYRFVHDALPELDLEEISTATSVFGKPLAAPLLISCMTGGTPEAERVNANLARAADRLGLAMGLGSARVLLEHEEVRSTFQVRPHAPDALLMANLGAVQLNRGVGVEDCRRLLALLDADALVLHLNPLQEALQPEGDTAFAGLLSHISDLCRSLEQPVVVKEVGWGLATDVVRALFESGVSAVDVAGAGGTSWSEVERHRLEPEWRQRVAAAFADWGIPTAEALREARGAAPSGLVFASGGIRDGVDVAKALALGADLVGLAGPFLRAATQGADRVVELGNELIDALRITMFCTGTRSISGLQGTARLVRSARRAPRVHSELLRHTTTGPGEFLDITDEVQAVAARAGIEAGQVHVFSNHTTAAIRINEPEPQLLGDFRELLEKLAPAGGYAHDGLATRVGVAGDEPINGHAHCRQLLLSTSETLPLTEGKLALGPWQRIFLVELCSARRRTITVQVLG